MRLRLGPIIEGQTVTRAVVTIEDVELVSESGASVVLAQGAMNVDLLAAQNDLDQLVQQQSIDVGRFTQLRFRLDSAFVEAIDAQSVTHVFASEGVDTSRLPAFRIARLGIGYVPEERRIFADLSVAENLAVARRAPYIELVRRAGV